MKVLQFDKFGKYITEFESVNAAKEATGCKHLIRCLFRETAQSGGFIYAFENDERLDENGNLKVYDYLVQYDPSGTLPVGYYKTPEECIDLERVSVHYLELEKKFDEKSYRIDCWLGKKKIGTFDNVAEARKVTGSPCIWSNLLGECKTTNDFVFKKEEMPF